MVCFLKPLARNSACCYHLIALVFVFALFDVANALSAKFLVSDYGTGSTAGNYFYRGYHIVLEEETTIVGLIGSCSAPEFIVGLYTLDASTFTPTSLLRHAVLTTSGTNIEMPVTPITLQANVSYLLTQGRYTGSGHHIYLSELRVTDIESASSRIRYWQPQTANSIRWSGSGDQNYIVNRPFYDFNGAMPRLGFVYNVTIQLGQVETVGAAYITDTSYTLLGKVIDDGGGDCTTYFLWSTNADPTSGGTYVQVGYGYNSGDTFNTSLSGLTMGTRYYFTAVCYNDAGRVSGNVLDFETGVVPSPSSTPSHTATTTPTRSSTPSSSPTMSHTPSMTVSLTSTASLTMTPTASMTASRTPSPTSSCSASQTMTHSPSTTTSPTSTASRTPSPTSSCSASQTMTHSPSTTTSPTSTGTPSMTMTPTSSNASGGSDANAANDGASSSASVKTSSIMYIFASNLILILAVVGIFIYFKHRKSESENRPTMESKHGSAPASGTNDDIVVEQSV